MCQIWSLKYVAIELSSPLWERITIFFGFHAPFYFYFSLAMKKDAWLTWMVMGVMESFGSPSQTVYSSAFPHAWPVSRWDHHCWTTALQLWGLSLVRDRHNESSRAETVFRSHCKIWAFSKLIDTLLLFTKIQRLHFFFFKKGKAFATSNVNKSSQHCGTINSHGHRCSFLLWFNSLMII